MDIDNFSNDESDLEIYLDLNLIGQFCSKIQSLSVEMAFVDFKSDKTERSSIFQKLTDLHLKGNKYRDHNPELSVLQQIFISLFLFLFKM